MILPGIATHTSKLFFASIPNTIYHKVNQTNVDDDLFVPDITDQIKKLLTVPETTLWALDSYVFSSKEYSDCKVSFTLGFESIHTLLKEIQYKVPF